MRSAIANIENASGSLAMLAMVILPLAEMVVRRGLGHGLPGSGPIVQHLTLWVGFLGAAMAARDLASYRFKRPILEVCVAALPMMAILGIGVLIITYVPWLTTGLLTMLGR